MNFNISYAHYYKKEINTPPTKMHFFNFSISNKLFASKIKEWSYIENYNCIHHQNDLFQMLLLRDDKQMKINIGLLHG